MQGIGLLRYQSSILFQIRWNIVKVKGESVILVCWVFKHLLMVWVGHISWHLWMYRFIRIRRRLWYIMNNDSWSVIVTNQWSLCLLLKRKLDLQSDRLKSRWWTKTLQRLWNPKFGCFQHRLRPNIVHPPWIGRYGRWLIMLDFCWRMINLGRLMVLNAHSLTNVFFWWRSIAKGIK
jgi:hypothetical protein